MRCINGHFRPITETNRSIPIRFDSFSLFIRAALTLNRIITLNREKGTSRHSSMSMKNKFRIGPYFMNWFTNYFFFCFLETKIEILTTRKWSISSIRFKSYRMNPVKNMKTNRSSAAQFQLFNWPSIRYENAFFTFSTLLRFQIQVQSKR